MDRPRGNFYRGRGRRHRGGGANYGGNYPQQDYEGEGFGAGNDRNYYRGGRGKKRGRDRHEHSGERPNRPPPGLKGREIGLWYAARSKRGKQEREDKNSVLHLDSEKRRDLTQLLSNIRAADNCPPQPRSRYADPFQDIDDQESAASTRNFDNPGTSKSKAWREQRKVTSSASSSTQQEPPDSWEQEQEVKSDEEDWFSSSGSVISQSDDSASERDEEEGRASPRFHLQLYEQEGEKEESEFLFEYQRHKEENRRGNQPDDLDDVRLQRNNSLDQKLLEEQNNKEQNPKYQKMLKFRKNLPSYKMQDEVVSLVSSNQVVVISGETGCGKTTQVPQFILDDYIKNGKGSVCRIVCTQPRRISAISVGERVAQERAEECGEKAVGYQIRLDARKPRDQGSILYCTTGILLQWLASDRLLSKTSHVILDEIHERDLQTDFLMIILKDLLPKRPDLKLVLMSATLNAEQFSQYFYNCPMLNIPGFTFPVKEYLLEDILEITGCNCKAKPLRKRSFSRGGGGRSKDDRNEQMEELAQYKHWCDHLPRKYSSRTKDQLKTLEDFEPIDIDVCADLTEYICKEKEDGAILVFLPGWAEIKKLKESIEARNFFRSNGGRYRIIPLHSLMPTVNQREVFERPPSGVRKIIIATNIAETSITIDDVVYVIDCGKIKMKNYDADKNIQSLKPEWVSKANAKQRRGRAGRVQAGECYHLYTEFHESRLADYQLPEMLRTRLEELCLHIKLLKMGFVEPFVQKAMQPPSIAALKQSLRILRDLNALDHNEDLTPLGYHLAKMPVDPQSGKMLLYSALFSCVDPIMTVAASLSFKDAFYVPLGKEREADERKLRLAGGSQSDHVMLINAYKGWERAKSCGTHWQYCKENFLSSQTLHMLSDMRKQFALLLHEMKFLESPNPKALAANRNSDNTRILKAVICAGLFPNVAQITKVVPNPKPDKPHHLKTKTDHKVMFHPKSVNSRETNFTSQWVMYHLKMKINAISLFDSSIVSPLSLLFFGGDITVEEGQGRKDKNSHLVNIGGHVTLKTSEKTCDVVNQLRYELDQVLEYKISHPGAIDWNVKTKEGAVIRAIIDLIKTEVEATPDFGRRKTTDVTCHNCGEKGHFRKKCPY